MDRGLTVALVVFNEQKNLARALASVLPNCALSFPWEILVIDNGSSDGTFRVFEKFREQHPEIVLRWISSGLNHLGKARHIAFTQAQYHVVSFIDADCTAPSQWMERFYAELAARETQDPQLLSLGSGNIPPSGGERFHQALRIMFSSWLGSMNSIQVKPLADVQAVRHLPTCNVFYLRERALAIGGFSEHFGDVCEDLEFSWRAVSAGLKLFYIPGLEVTHHHKPGLQNWSKKMFRYGRGQIKVARSYPWHLWGVKGVPLLVSSFAALSFFFFPLATISAALLYLIFLGFYSASLCLARGRLDLIPQVFFLLASTHLFYSLGEVWGACTVRKYQNGKVK